MLNQSFKPHPPTWAAECGRACRNVEHIKGQFHNILDPIDALLRDSERTKASLHDTRLKFAAATSAHDQLRQEHASVVSERDAIAEIRDTLHSENRQLSQSLRNADSAVAEAQLAISDRTLKLDRLERELEGASRRVLALIDETQALRASLDAKEKAPADVEQKRAALFDQHNIVQQEGRALRARIEDQSAQLSRVGRQFGDLEIRHGDLGRRAVELETALGQESSAHSRLKNQHQEDSDWNRANTASLQVDLAATRARAEAAERLLSEARQELREHLMESRVLERKLLDSTVAASAAEKRFAELEKDLSGAREQIADLEASRTNLVDRSAALAKASKIKEGVLQKAEQKIDYLETRMGELTKSFNAQRAQLESKAAQLSEQLEAEGAARAFAVGALQSARRDRLSLQSELIALKEGAFSANDETSSAHAEAQLAEPIGGVAETSVRLIG
jgi:chromosome segregation ATPase